MSELAGGYLIAVLTMGAALLTYFLALRPDPEPQLAGEVDAVRQKLAALGAR